MSDVRDELRCWITLRVYGGYDTDNQIVARALDEWQVWREGASMAIERDGIFGATNDPVARLLLSGRAATLREAEELYLDSCLPKVVRLLASSLSDEELGRHPLMVMLRSHGSRSWEEAVD
jgi:hypothetical protein